MDIIRLFEDFNIPHWTEGKNVSYGWVNVQCPFPNCGDTSNHLGWNLEKQYFRCWKCGWHPLRETLSKLLNLDRNQLSRIFKEYGSTERHLHPVENKSNIRIGGKQFKLPSDIGIMQRNHKIYLHTRGFDPIKLQEIWGVLGTGPTSILDDISFKHRIVAPIIWNGKVVSFQARDITDRHLLRYITCPKDRERIHHKHILYGMQNQWGRKAIIVEGITDVWRLGPIACATFGIEYTKEQIFTIEKNFEEVGILFDQEPQAQRKAFKLAADLKFMGIHAFVIKTKQDPGSMKQEDADGLVQDFKKGFFK